ncbi:hypothetical protein PQX77_006517 [Marasmius sp. AFHP31]|nr:hypothetical protein PQX77_006517 [Marasmius sp. AFHP31]
MPGSAELPSGGKNSGNHWVAIAIDTIAHTISYGDSLRKPPPAELSNILIWWMNRLFPEQPFEIKVLPCGKQTDGSSCGFYAINAIEHFIDAGIDLFADTINIANHRFAWFEKLSTYISQTVSPRYIVTVANGSQGLFFWQRHQHKTVNTNSVPLKPTDNPPPPLHPSSQPKTEPKSSNSPSSIPKDVQPRSDGKRKHEQTVPKSSGVSSQSPPDSDIVAVQNEELYGNDIEEEYAPGDYILLPPDPIRFTGAPKKALYNKLLLPCYRAKDGPECKRYKCVGVDCGKSWVNRCARATRHVLGCRHVPQELKDLAKGEVLKKAPSMVLAEKFGVEVHGIGFGDDGDNGSSEAKDGSEPPKKKARSMMNFCQRGRR